MTQHLAVYSVFELVLEQPTQAILESIVLNGMLKNGLIRLPHLFRPPKSVRRLVSIQACRLEMPVDKTSFTEALPLLALRVPKQRCQELMKKFRG